MKMLNNKKKFFFFVLLLVGGGVFLFSAPVFASASDWAGRVVGGLISILISALGTIMVLVIRTLLAVSQYNDFINAPAIENGWSIVRDVCNMFFIVVLLIIAFATILNQQKYSYKTWLPKLILMAILINFSKTICGLIIDLAQVVMMTFVNAFKGMAAGNFVENLGITEVVTLANNDAELGFWAIAGAYILGLLYMLVGLVVLITMVAMLVMRMVMIWIYVVLSPAAYVLAAFPGGQRYSSMWWSEFTKNVIVGPVLAFFIWLSFVSLQQFDYKKFNVEENFDGKMAGAEIGINPSEKQYSNVDSGATTKAGELDVFLKFIISIGMLIGGLKISSEIGGAAGGIANKGMNKLQQGAAFAGNKLKQPAVSLGRAAKTGAKNLGMAAVNQKGVRNALDVMGSQNKKGILGAALKMTGLRSLAQKGSIALGNHKEAVEEKAKKKVSALKKSGASRTVANIASENAKTMGQEAAKKEAGKIFVVPAEKFNKAHGVEGLTDPDDKKEAERRLKEFDFKKEAPSLNQIMQLGKSGINLSAVPKFKAFLEKNAGARGAYNDGQLDGGLTGFVIGTDKNGDPLTGADRFGTRTLDPDDINKAMGRGKDGYAFREREEKLVDSESTDGSYKFRKKANKKTQQKRKPVVKETPEILEQRKKIAELSGSQDGDVIERTRKKIDSWNRFDNTDHFQNESQIKEAFSQVQNEQQHSSQNKSKIEEDRSAAYEKKLATPGRGNLSVNGFARGEQDYVGVDFGKLDPQIQEKMSSQLKTGENLSDLKGATTQDKAEIGKIAKSMIEILDQEINKIKNNNIGQNMSQVDQKRVDKLEQAKQKFQNPEDIKNLELINTSAKGYTNSKDVAETIIHEDMHGKVGIKSEKAVDFMAHQAAYSGQGIDARKGADIQKRLDEYMDHAIGNKSRSTKKAAQVLDMEAGDDDLNEYNYRSRSVNDIKNGAAVVNIINEKGIDRENLKNSYRNNLNNNKDSYLVYYLKNLVKSLNSLKSTISTQTKSNKVQSVPPQKKKFDNKNDALK